MGWVSCLGSFCEGYDHFGICKSGPIMCYCNTACDPHDHVPLSTKDLLSCMRHSLAVRDHPADRERHANSRAGFWRSAVRTEFRVKPIP